MAMADTRFDIRMAWFELARTMFIAQFVHSLQTSLGERTHFGHTIS